MMFEVQFTPLQDNAKASHTMVKKSEQVAKLKHFFFLVLEVPYHVGIFSDKCRTDKKSEKGKIFVTHSCVFDFVPPVIQNTKDNCW